MYQRSKYRKSKHQRIHVEGYSSEFKAFWEAYPRKIGKRSAWTCWNARLNEGVSADDMLLACRNYGRYVRSERVVKRYVMYPGTFLGSNLRYQDWIHPSGKGPEVGLIESSITASAPGTRPRHGISG